jgi:putative ABC transport system permease protein
MTAIVRWVEALFYDLRYSVRGFRRAPGLVVVSALSLGLGIGLNAILYMGIRTVFWHEPTMRNPGRVVSVEPGSGSQISYPDYQDLQQSAVFESVVGFRIMTLNYGAAGRVTRIGATAVTANFFEALGIDVQLGRTFSARDDAPARDPRVVMVTSTFWRTNFKADPAAIGQSVMIDGEPFTVIGVLPDRYRAVTGFYSPPVYVPLSKLTLSSIDNRTIPSLTVLGRLRRDVNATQTQQEVSALLASLDRAYPARVPIGGQPASVSPVAALQFRGTPSQFTLLAGVTWVTACLVLLIACVNVTGLLMVRATERRRELAMRTALGAGRGRVVASLLGESFLLVAAGAALGLPLAFALTKIPVSSAMAPLREILVFDTRLLPYAAGLIAVATLICGVIPALRATRADVVTEIRQGGESVTPRMRLRQALVAAQVAMAFVLIVAGLLCVRSQIQLTHVDFGFELDKGVVANFGLTDRQYPEQERVRLAERLVERIAQLPGVSLVSVANIVPLGGNALGKALHPAGRTDIPGTRPTAYSTGPGYFSTLGIPLLKGREFGKSDREGAPAVAIVNATFARTYFPGQEALGQHVETAGEVNSEVVGVVQDHRIGTIGEQPRSVIFYPYAQRPTALTLHVRCATAPESLVSVVQRAIGEIVDANVPVRVQTLRNATSLEMTMRRQGTVLMATLGAVGLFLAVIGLYGVMTYTAASRTVEVGIRMALGASRGRIRREMLLRTLKVVAPGLAVGMLAALAAMPAFRTFLAGVSPFDPLAFAGGAALLIIVGLAAGYVPAHRSARLDPMRALRRP